MKGGGGGNDPFYFLPFPLSTSACQKGKEGKGGGGGGGRARETFPSLRFLHGDDFRGLPAACAEERPERFNGFVNVKFQH